MKIIKYLLAFVLGLIVVIGLAQFVTIVITFIKHPEAGFAYAFGELVGTLLITVIAGAGATILFSSARAATSAAEDSEPGT